MAFNVAQTEATIEKLNSGIVTLSAKLNQVGPRAESTVNHWYVPDAVAKPLIWFANKIIEIGCWIRDKIIECLKGAAAPVMMYLDSQDWEGPALRGKVSGVAGNLAPEALKAPIVWKGEGANAYVAAVKGQPTAATQIETSADKLASALMICAAGGMAFYLALAAVLIKAIVITIAAIAATASVVFSWAGFLGFIGEALSDAGIITGLLVALAGLLTSQLNAITTAKGEANDNSAFPEGKWPIATA
ncbi:hypothetical protein QMK19_21575 [Streptomyces sp. H10-C2]|uniref:hypothetical protein n=1 Tax=unclassified Streptomyces TaxID=2593676 RepID=UPI0024B8C548|nr:MULTISPECIES: hypothetical protein [unclassified Streptomyces]MDJ0342327.1 hypothetical protein [Streptomyces sp. PH10-H1]MDJ0372182.1 hypothetical protein [Streptomyces sp. H10-C2]